MNWNLIFLNSLGRKCTGSDRYLHFTLFLHFIFIYAQSYVACTVFNKKKKFIKTAILLTASKVFGQYQALFTTLPVIVFMKLRKHSAN